MADIIPHRVQVDSRAQSKMNMFTFNLYLYGSKRLQVNLGIIVNYKLKTRGNADPALKPDFYIFLL